MQSLTFSDWARQLYVVLGERRTASPYSTPIFVDVKFAYDLGFSISETVDVLLGFDILGRKKLMAASRADFESAKCNGVLEEKTDDAIGPLPDQEASAPLQNRFRIRLFAIREEQLRVAAINAAAAKKAWEAKMAPRIAWWKRCNALCCEHCGGMLLGRNSPFEFQKRMCGCTRTPSRQFIVDMLQRLAGIWGGHAQIRTEWSDWYMGPEGFRSCSASSWDNAVKAMEEG